MEDAGETLVMASRFQARSLDKLPSIHTSLRLTLFGACVCLLPSIAAISFAGAALGSRGLAVAPHPFNGWILAQADLHHCTLANLIHCIPHA